MSPVRFTSGVATTRLRSYILERVRAMKARGDLTPKNRANYRAILERLRAIEERRREPRLDGEREFHRIARWSLDRWKGEDRSLLEFEDRDSFD